MSFARRAPYGRAFGSLVVLGLGLSLEADRVMASQHDVLPSLNPADLQLAASVLQDTLEQRRSGDPRFWRNETTGSSGSVMPMRTFRIKTGHFCRTYRETVVAESKLASRDLTACRSEDGIWVKIE